MNDWGDGTAGSTADTTAGNTGVNDPAELVAAGVYLRGGGAQADPEAVTPTGEIHLGSGAGFVNTPQSGRGGGGGRYFHAPAHNTAIIYHEVGHHVCRTHPLAHA